MFKGRQFDQSLILLCVRWFLAVLPDKGSCLEISTLRLPRLVRSEQERRREANRRRI